MDFKPKYIKTHPLSHVVTIESVLDKRGNVLFAVTISKGERKQHFCFKHLSSAVDFFSTNFDD